MTQELPSEKGIELTKINPEGTSPIFLMTKLPSTADDAEVLDGTEDSEHVSTY